ncbi:hypothetical protein Tco_0921599 [Tanacetum coccineum]
MSATKRNFKVGSKKTATSSLFDALNSVESDNILGSNGGILTNANDEMTKPSNVSTNSNTVNKAGKSIDGMDNDNESDVEHVYNETTCFMAPKSRGGAEGKSLYERCKEDNEYVPYYDDDVCVCAR